MMSGMSLIWINGEIMPMADARIGVEDRGFQFADGVYEVIHIYNGKPFTLDRHLDRLKQSAAGIQLSVPLDQPALAQEIRRLISRTAIADGMVYLQLTRGVAERNHAFPTSAKPTLLFYTRPLPPVIDVANAPGVKLLSVPDERWKRCWIKSIALLPNVLAKNAALAAGCDEAVFIDDGIVTECSSSNFFAIINGRLTTHPVGPKVLPGITSMALLECAVALKIPVDQRPLRQAEAMAADELFISSTTREISWVNQWDGKTFGAGRCGPITQRLHAALRQCVLRETQ
jgi:D-alanine transaminase